MFITKIARMLSGDSFDNFGKLFDVNKLGKLDLVKGMIVHIDNFGLMKIYGDKISYNEGQKLKIYKNGEYALDAKFANRMMCLDDNEWALYSGSSLNFPELGSVRNKYGYKEIDAKIGDIITWETA